MRKTWICETPAQAEKAKILVRSKVGIRRKEA